MDKLLIVDGSNLLFQMFYGMPTKIIGRGGRQVQGTVGFVGALLKMIRMTKPTHVAVLFDGESENERVALDPSYKANRPDFSEMPEDEVPFTQLPDIYAALDELGIKHAETTMCETDDWIAAYALSLGDRCDIVISSFDSDFFQLITDRVSVLRYRGDASMLLTPAHIYEKLGVYPEQYADYKCMVGDTADNIRGVAKVGPKTAATLLAEYKTLDALLLNAQTIKRPAIRQSIIEGRERLMHNRRLILLDGCAEIPFELSELKYTQKGLTSGDVLRKIGVFQDKI